MNGLKRSQVNGARAIQDADAKGAAVGAGSFWKSLSLTSQFGLAAFLITSIGMAILGHWVSWHTGQSIIKAHAASSATHFEDLIEPYIKSLDHGATLDEKSRAAIDKIVSDGKRTVNLLALNLWGADGTVLYSQDRTIVGMQYALSDNISSAFSGRLQYHAHDKDDPGDELISAPAAPDGMFEIYAPIRSKQTQKILGVAEIYFSPNSLHSELSSDHWRTALVISAFALAMLGALSIIVRRGSVTIDQQRRDLEQQIKELSRLLKENQELKMRIAGASRRVTDTNEALLKQVRADLHDGPTQLISYALLRFDEIGSGNGRDDAVRDVHKALDDALVELRQISAGFALPELDRLSIAQTIELATRNHEERSRTEVALKISDSLPVDVALTVKSCVFRLIQEGLNNAFRHAGGLEQNVSVCHSGDEISLEISDGGPGINDMLCPDGANRLGLVGLRNRVEALGGKFEIGRRTTGLGTALKARIPFATE